MDLRRVAFAVVAVTAAAAALSLSLDVALKSSHVEASSLKPSHVAAAESIRSLTETAPQSVLGKPLELCSTDPMTGYMRDGYCKLTPSDTGTHVVCARVTSAFLEFTKSRGNDLSTPFPEYSFPGLKDGDQWCLCALRWKEAYGADPAVAPPVVLGATHKHALDFVSEEDLKSKAVV